MRNSLAILTVVGGHFVPGRRRIGAVFFLLLLIAPVLAVLAPIPFSFLRLTPSAIGNLISAAYLIVIALIWIGSVRVAIRHLKREKLPEGKSRFVEPILAGVLAWFVIGVGLIVMVVGIAPFEIDRGRVSISPTSGVTKGEQGKVVEYKKLPPPNGSVELLGRVERKGQPLAKERIRLIFADGFASELALIDDQGEFTIRLPAGQWRLIGPELSSNKDAAVQYEVVGAQDLKSARNFSVSMGPPTTKIQIRIWFE